MLALAMEPELRTYHAASWMYMPMYREFERGCISFRHSYDTRFLILIVHVYRDFSAREQNYVT